MLNKNDIIEIMIEDLTVEGAGIGRYNGMAVFVPRALPGEQIKAKIIKLTKSYAAGKLIEILQPSEDRTAPFCAYFEDCGGCTLQHLSYEGQLKYKSRYIKECFKRLGGIDIDEPQIVAADNIMDYRNKASFPVSMKDGSIKAGFYAPRSHRLIAVDCPIQKSSVNGVKDAIIDWVNRERVSAYDEEKHSGVLRHIIARQASNGDVMAGVVTNRDIDASKLAAALKGVKGIKSVVINSNKKRTNAILGEKEKAVYGDAYITEEFGGLKFRAGLSSFLQVNHEQAEKLYGIAMEYAKISNEDVVFDLFCGIGTLSLIAAKKAKVVLGIEYVKAAVENAKENAALNGLTNAQFMAGDAQEMIDRGIELIGKPDIVILDPPRKGCGEKLIEKLAAVKPLKIVYVSCNPATLARDLAIFKAGGYEVGAVKGVDMFPHTTHVETVVLMSRVED